MEKGSAIAGNFRVFSADLALVVVFEFSTRVRGRPIALEKGTRLAEAETFSAETRVSVSTASNAP